MEQKDIAINGDSAIAMANQGFSYVDILKYF
jgi:hypothetical protein